ncbi:T9SS C-terminal target domain-containing protein [bacterium]|nr:MAG: T9SS C-terminal target domain-containing protein [bacterium]
MMTARINSEGDSLWVRGLSGGTGRSKGFAATETADGGYAVVGYFYPYPQPDPRWVEMLIVRVDSLGNTLWAQTCGREHRNESAHAICETPDGGFIVAGDTPYDFTGPAGLLLARLDAAGNVLWTHAEEDSAELTVRGIKLLSDGSFIVAGELEQDIIVMRFVENNPPQSFERVLPEDSSLFGTVPYVDFSWTASINPDGDDVTYLLHIESDYADFPDYDAATADTSLRVDIPIPLPDKPLDEVFEFHWTVHATANGDTVAASNGEGLFLMDIIDAIEETIALPAEFGLSVYPNPFNPSTTIEFSLPQAGWGKLVVYDLLGRQRAELVNRVMPAGGYQLNWSCPDCASGVYLAELQCGDIRATQKLLLLR